MFEHTASMITWKPLQKKPLFPKHYPKPLILSQGMFNKCNPFPYVCVYVHVIHIWSSCSRGCVYLYLWKPEVLVLIRHLVNFIFLFVSWDRIHHWDLHLTNEVRLADQQVLGTCLSLSPHCCDYEHVSSCLLSLGSRGANCGLDACVANTLLAELSP